MTRVSHIRLGINFWLALGFFAIGAWILGADVHISEAMPPHRPEREPQ